MFYQPVISSYLWQVNQELYYKEKAHGPPHLKYCGTGDYLCRGYNETVITDGWFYDLADLDQSHPFVRKFLKEWVKYMVPQQILAVLLGKNKAQRM